MASSPNRSLYGGAIRGGETKASSGSARLLEPANRLPRDETGGGSRTTAAAHRLGLLVSLSLILTCALFAAPFIAAHQEFGHTHSDGAPHHLHAVSALLASVTNGAVAVTDSTPLLLFSSALPARAPAGRRALNLACPTRAPPFAGRAL